MEFMWVLPALLVYGFFGIISVTLFNRNHLMFTWPLLWLFILPFAFFMMMCICFGILAAIFAKIVDIVLYEA